MEDPSFPAPDDPSSLWDWENLFNFPLHPEEEITQGPFILPWTATDDVALQSGHHPPHPIRQAAPAKELGRVRKRDPRLICPNYLTGKVPCACPELDEKAAEEEEEEEEAEVQDVEIEIVAGARKRIRKGGSGIQIEVRCQVPGCEADIKELKGYHRRHRVCLRCANATHVMLQGEQKRYCQQCGK
jgi:SBP domain